LSNLLKAYSPAEARKARVWNGANAGRIGWKGSIPPRALVAYPALVLDASGIPAHPEDFASAVAIFQDVRGLVVDGCLGHETWAAILRAFDRVDPYVDPYVVQNGRRLLLPSGSGVYVKAFDTAEGYDLHPGGAFTRATKLPNRRPRRIVLHWGGVDARSCVAALRNRELSSHFGVDRAEVFQWLDLANQAWHAGWANEDSIGIDVCQQPTVGFEARYSSPEYSGVRRVPNLATRGGKRLGDREVLTLDDRTAANVRALCFALCELFEIEPIFLLEGVDGPISHRVVSREEFRAFSGILCHSNVSASKWDIAPWMGQIFGVP